MPATCIPDMGRASFRHPQGEWEVYEALREGLDTDWFLLAELERRLDDTQNVQEMDLLLIHADHGMILIEAKSYEMKVSEGVSIRIGETPRTSIPSGSSRDQHQALTDRPSILGPRRLPQDPRGRCDADADRPCG